MEKILGIDLGTNSIGLSNRNKDNGGDIENQLDFFMSYIFKSGVGKGKSGEFSYAVERTKKRSSRRLYQSRKYRIWETLKILINFGYCPLSIEDLEKWSKYSKHKGLKRQYPVNALKFEQWVRLDFNGDGIADYDNPYQLRAELINEQYDFENETNRFKLGRALYHIAQRRGFRSSKGETIKEQEKNEIENGIDSEIDISKELKKSEEKQSKDLIAYMTKYQLQTVGCAYDKLIESGIRVRSSIYQAVRSQYKDEIQKIFEFQKGLNIKSDFYKHIISEKKGEGSIFYKRPLRSQKGMVGKCTLETNKSRCPISHPEFEKFRAWCFINNIQYRKTTNDDWQPLNIDQKNKLYKDVFLQTRSNFAFEKIRLWIEKEITFSKLEYSSQSTQKTINYKDKTNVSGCPISGRLKNLLGDNWEKEIIISEKKRVNKKNGEIHQITYNAESLWHICFSFEEIEYVTEFAKNDLNFDENKTKQLVRIWGAIQQGYGMLCLKAIKSINRFLLEGFIYSDATMLAKLPEILGEECWLQNEKKIKDEISILARQNRIDKQVLNIANELISNYKSLGYNDETQSNERFAEHNADYKLDESDYHEVEKCIIQNVGEKTWKGKSLEEKNAIVKKVADLYQQFFASTKRDYFRLPRLYDTLKKYLSDNFDFLHCTNEFKDKNNKENSCNCEICTKLNKIYHPSMIEFYKPAEDQRLEDGRSMKLLGSPVIGVLKNPMAMRVLHILRKQINSLLIDGIIDQDTRIVVETAREMNDANMRWAIETYQREREKENKEYESVIKQYYPKRKYNDDDIDKVRLLIDQHDIPENSNENIIIQEVKAKKNPGKMEAYKKDITKYRLWLEQGCRCIYTGKIINITNLFDENSTDFEHTVPRSLSFDNSLANLTVCDSYYNRVIKKNQIPTQLANYEKEANGYSAILPRLKPWFEKVEQLKDNVEFWKFQSKRTQDKDRKDYCIRQRHLWQMELDYWQNKVSRFTMPEVTSGFRHSQLNDTRIITKYAYHYLKSVFSNVEVQKGSVTADFRKMLGVQSLDEKKSRDKHSHHAIDATMLTLIPVAAKRDKMLELFYEKEEEKHLNGESARYKSIENELNREIRQCGFGKDVASIVPFIEENILVNHISKDQTLTPAIRKARKKGKEIFLRDRNGNLIKDRDGNPVNKWITGDCIRGQLHGETFYGAITQAQKDDKGKLLRDDNGKLQIKEEIYYVVRKELKYKKNDLDSGFKTWEELENAAVNKELIQKLKKQYENTPFKDACEQGIFVTDRKGNQVNRIRHIRCYAETKNPIIIKQQTYLSDKTYKQNYYATNGENIYYALYWDEKTDSIKSYDYRSLMQIAQFKHLYNNKNIEDYFPQSKQVIRGRSMTEIPLYAILKNGTRVLFYTPKEWEENKSIVGIKQMFFEMSKTDKIKRLYQFIRLFPDGRVQFRYHLEARNDSKLENDFPKEQFGKRGKNGFSEVNITTPYPKLLISSSNISCLIEDKDFVMDNNDIKFL